MILAHGMDAWLLPAAKTGTAHAIVQVASGIPARLFLLLVGISAAIQFEAGIRKGLTTAEMRRRLARRGILVLVLAYLFRLQEWVLSHYYGGWETLFKVDILNAIGACMLLLAVVATPRQGRRQVVPSLLVASIFLGFGPLVGPLHFPAWLPAPLTAYLGGERPMAWFSLFPWGAWAFAGVAVGHYWLRANRDPRLLERCFSLTFFAGLVMTATVSILRLTAPTLIHYPTEVVRQMGPGIFFHRMGLVGMLAGIGFFWCRAWHGRFSVLRQLGRTSLLVYWVHVELCYGSAVYSLRDRFEIPAALLLFISLTLAMLALSLAKTHLLPPATRRLRASFRPAHPS